MEASCCIGGDAGELVITDCCAALKADDRMNTGLQVNVFRKTSFFS